MFEVTFRTEDCKSVNVTHFERQMDSGRDRCAWQKALGLLLEKHYMKYTVGGDTVQKLYMHV